LESTVIICDLKLDFPDTGISVSKIDSSQKHVLQATQLSVNLTKY